ncbi:MAG: DUF1461 domain-containing protein [Halofilum sp. (in: g-proteobacteria)]|nr:DUF1461 domain-containing protein [Halofilum sp. (in: g-proteobacteria)]
MASNPLLRRGLYMLRWSVLVLAVVIGCLFVVWRGLAAVDFAYPWLHGLLDIGATVAEHGPRNPVRPGFERTDAAEQARLFGAIVDAVRADGRGLAELIYRTPGGQPIGRLLTPAEIQHLQDVARLIGRFERLGWLALALLPLLLGAAAVRRERPPSGRRLGLSLGGGVAVAALTVLLLGPVEVFYWLHEQVFPPGHQWFFWYQESLMSMLMQAPNLFGAIAILWFVPAALLSGLALWAILHGLRRRAGEGNRE